MFSECTNVRLVEHIQLDELGLGYKCVFMEPGTPHGRILVQWLVNGVNADSFDAQFEIINSQTSDGVKSISKLWIKDPVALRGHTEIKCSVMGVNKIWHMNSKILLNVLKY